MRIVGIIIFFIFTLSINLYCWGPITHIYIAMEGEKQAGVKIPNEGYFYAGTTEPDIGAGGANICSSGVSNVYSIYHDPDFVEAMKEVANSKPEPERSKLLAIAAGYASHQAGDSVAHTWKGYPNTKKIFDKNTPGNYLPDHITTEFFTDLLCYKEKKAEIDKIALKFIDEKTLAEVIKVYAKKKGEKVNIDEEQLKQDILKHQATVLGEITIFNYLLKKKPELVKEIDEFFSDRYTGVGNKGGINESIQVQKELFETHYKNSDIQAATGINEFLSDLGTQIVKNSAVTAGGGIVDIVSHAKKIDFVNKELEKVIDAKLSSRAASDRMVANLLKNVIIEDMSFREAIYEAQKFISTPENQKLIDMEEELNILKEKVDKAYKEWKNRPWWKFWLYFTNSDKKKYLALKKEYDKKLEEYQKELEKFKNKLQSDKKNYTNTDVGYLYRKMVILYNKWIKEGRNPNSPTYKEYIEVKKLYEKYSHQ